MSGHRHFRPHPGDTLVRPDQESGAHDTHEFAAVHRFLLPHAIGLDHAVLFVRGERDRKPMLGLELVLRRYRIGGDAEYLRTGFAERALEAGEVDGLLGAPRGVRPRVEIKHELLPGEVGERNGSAAVAGEHECGGFGAGIKLAGHMPSFRRFRSFIVTVRIRACVDGVDDCGPQRVSQAGVVDTKSLQCADARR